MVVLLQGQLGIVDIILFGDLYPLLQDKHFAGMVFPIVFEMCSTLCACDVDCMCVLCLLWLVLPIIVVLMPPLSPPLAPDNWRLTPLWQVWGSYLGSPRRGH